MYVCICKGITDTTIREAVLDGASSFREVRDQLGVSSECGQCACEARRVVKETLKDLSVTDQGIFYAA